MFKGGLISEGIFTLVPFPKNLNKLFTVMGRKFKTAQESDLTPFVGNGTKFKIPFEIKPPLMVQTS